MVAVGTFTDPKEDFDLWMEDVDEALEELGYENVGENYGSDLGIFFGEEKNDGKYELVIRFDGSGDASNFWLGAEIYSVVNRTSMPTNISDYPNYFSSVERREEGAYNVDLTDIVEFEAPPMNKDELEAYIDSALALAENLWRRGERHLAKMKTANAKRSLRRYLRG